MLRRPLAAVSKHGLQHVWFLPSRRALRALLRVRLLRSDAESRPSDRLADRGHVGVGRETHLPALEIDGEGCSAGARRGTGDGLYAAVAIHAGDLEDEFLSHVI